MCFYRETSGDSYPIHQMKKEEVEKPLTNDDHPLILKDFSGGFPDRFFMKESDALKASEHMLSLYPCSRCQVIPNPKYKNNQ